MRAPGGTLLRRCLLLGVGLGLVVSCSDPDQPSTLPTDTPTSTSSSASPSTSTATTQDEVEAAVRAYYAELTRAAQTNDTATLKRLVTRGCPCYRPIRVIDEGAAQGQVTPDAAWTIKSLAIHDVEGNTALADVKYDVTAYDVEDETGNVLGRVEAQSSHYDLSLVKAPRGWIIGNLFNLEG